VKNSSKKHNFFLGFFAPDAYKLQPSYISDQNLQKITLNYFQSGVLTIIETTKIILRDGLSVKNSSKKHNFFLGFFAPDAYKLQPSYISDQNLQKITLNYFQSGVLTIIETTKIILRDGSR
jgi:UDP-N-acetyl-D-mannosaminuronic acid transferase (WecB/TagA/CpsF family)